MIRPEETVGPATQGGANEPPTHHAALPVDELIPTRWSLLSRIKDWQDQDSWRVFFDTYWRLIYCVARKAGLSDPAAQDVVQETLLTVARKLPEFKTYPEAGSFKGWLLQITRRRIIDQWRKLNRHDKVIEPDPDDDRRTALLERLPDSGGLELERLWEKEWETNLFEVALERLKQKVSPRQYQIFDLYVLKQWPVRDISRVLNVNAGQIYIAKHRVSSLLKKELKSIYPTFA
jgi:RNA polymerase sigma-70 factor (ECF subfamily)